MTDQLVNIANSCCEGRIVSALEGGYQLGGEYSSAFAKSVKAHVTSLIHGGDRRAGYSQEQCDRDTETENKVERTNNLPIFCLLIVCNLAVQLIEKLEAVREEELARREALRQEREEQEERRLMELRQAMLLSEGLAAAAAANGESSSSSSSSAAEVASPDNEGNSKKRRRPQVGN